jgi:ATP/maltotriose-dependent transcriptional regulator MalT/DNA-binding SARP family transcriptional activator
MAQRSSTTAFAKSTRPEIAGVVAREALFTRLDGTPARTVAWISAPPGFGKTTLVASYLEARSYRWAWYQVDADDDDGETFLHYLGHAMRRLRPQGDELPAYGNEHRADLAAFARRYFRALFSGAVGPVALVLDNLNEMAADSPLRTILEAGLPQVPRQCCVIVTSRTPPPVALARLQPGGAMVCLSADDLRISTTDLAAMARLRGRPLAEDALQTLQQRADGWAAALVLMVEHHKLTDSQPNWSSEATPKAVFDYLAGEIFERFDGLTRRLLLQVACLPRVTIDVARTLTGDESVGRVLFSLAHNDYFVRELVGPEGRVFVFHPLLREFLLERAARELPQAVGPTAQRRAARLLREAGQADEALALLVACKDWHDVASIIDAEADGLLAQGRHATLAAWIELLPPPVLATLPALQQAQGMALLQTSPRVARRRFEDAFRAFERTGDPHRASACCLGVLDALLAEFDDLTGLDTWLAEFDRLHDAMPNSGQQPASVLVARLWRGPGRSDRPLPAAGRRFDASARAQLALATQAWLGGDFARSESIAKDIDGAGTGIGPARAAADTLRQLADGQPGVARESARLGLALADAEAVHGHDRWLRLLGAAAALAEDDFDAARAELEAAGALNLRRGDRAFVHVLRAALARGAGEPGAALREARSALQVAVEAGLPWVEGLARIAMAQLMSATGDRPGAEAQLRAADAVAIRLDNPLLRLAGLLTAAAVAVESGDEAGALAPLQAGLSGARELGVHHVPGLPRPTMGALCATALRHNIAADHARLLINTGRLDPPPAALRLRRWPWAFEITTLGGFALQRSGAAIEFSAKGPGRPLELLKVLIAMGGQNVRADQLADALWPHVDADYAHKSFTATLHRLRRIFDGDDTLRLRDGRLSLNPSLFWLDSWALDHVLGEMEDGLRGADLRAADASLHGLVDELLALYKGPFLPDEAEQPTYIARREQIRGRLLRVLTRTSRRWEELGRADAAVDCYLRCIDADELCEALYRNLMLCYQRHGEVAEALATYDRLHAVLAARLRSAPSPELQAIRAGMRA